MDFSNCYFGFSALYLILIAFSIIKHGKWNIVVCANNRFKLVLLGLLLNIIILMVLCAACKHCNGTYCLFFIGSVPLLILYYCLHLLTRTYQGVVQLLHGKKFPDMLSLFFLFPYVPTFVSIFKMMVSGALVTGIHEYESHIFIVTMYLLLDLLSSFFEDTSK